MQVAVSGAAGRKFSRLHVDGVDVRQISLDLSQYVQPQSQSAHLQVTVSSLAMGAVWIDQVSPMYQESGFQTWFPVTSKGPRGQGPGRGFAFLGLLRDFEARKGCLLTLLNVGSRRGLT